MRQWTATLGFFALAGCGDVLAQHDPAPDAAAPTPQLVPSNDAVIGELQPTGLALTIGTTTFDTDAQCTTTAALGTCAVVPRDGLAEICVCRADTLTIDTLHVHGSRALAILATDTVTIHTLVDVSASGATAGPGATRPPTGNDCAGGSFGSKGGANGYHQQSGDLYGTPELIPLEGGMLGHPTGNGAGIVIAGGGGGGAVQISAGQRIDVTGAIVAGGGGGMPNTLSWAAGAGGGSGGAILLESRTVSIVGSIAANGGGGGGAGGLSNAGNLDSVGTPGATSTGVPAAPGGFGGDGGCANGAQGGDGSSGDLAGVVGIATGADCGGVSPGTSGGGGGAGRIRINTTSGCACTGTLSPTPTFGEIVIR
jgi:hypothetical protein